VVFARTLHHVDKVLLAISHGRRARGWAAARTIYAGYEAYARRIAGRKIRIMVLSTVRPTVPLIRAGPGQ
jgi:hypothetical protein